MGIVKARVRDFQSIKDVSVDFGDFTVLVGPSSAGKSAFLRGIRACLRNNFVPAMVRSGQVKSQVDVTFDDTEVGIERGKSLSTYHLGQGASTFTKSARTVPPEVEKALSFPLISGVDATMSFQFDKPFLLSETGSVAAQVIGSLTNASLLHAAVREANRRSQEVSGTLKVRRADMDRYREQAHQFADLKSRGTAVCEAEALVEHARSTQERLQQVRSAVSRLRESRKSLESLTAIKPEDPTEAIEKADAVLTRLTTLKATLASLRAAHSSLRAEMETAESLRVVAAELEEEHDQYLKSLGRCPVCGSPTGDHR